MTEHFARRKELWEERRDASGQVDQKPQAGRPSSDTTDKTGVAKRDICRTVSRAEGVCGEASNFLKGTRLDNDASLMQSAKAWAQTVDIVRPTKTGQNPASCSQNGKKERQFR